MVKQKNWKKTAGSAAILGHLGPSWGHLGAILGHLGAVLGLSWGVWVAFGGVLESLGTWIGRGKSGFDLGLTWEMGRSWKNQGDVLETS